MLAAETQPCAPPLPKRGPVSRLPSCFLPFPDWASALGQTARIVDAWIGEDRRFVLQHATDPKFYYILRRGERITAILTAKDIQPGRSGTVQFKDPDLTDNAAAFYRVQ